MKIFCCFTPAHKILFDGYFSPSVPDSLSVTPFAVKIAGAGDFLSEEFLECIRRKMSLVIESIRENAGSTIVWSDVDIVFVRDPAEDLKEIASASVADIFFQAEFRGPESDEVNTGFILMRCSETVAVFFESVRDRMIAYPSKNEQAVINEMLREGPRLPDGSAIRWEKLPSRYFAKTHRWPPPADMVIYHANSTGGKNGVLKKIGQFRDLAIYRRFGRLGLAVVLLKKLPGFLFYKARMAMGRTREP